MSIILHEQPRSIIVTPQEVRERWCFGLPLTREDGTRMPDEDIAAFIESAVKEVERKLGIFLRPTKIVCHPERRNLVEGIDFDLEEPPYDYRYDEYRRWGFVQLRQYPIISVESVKLVLPNYQQIVDFPKDWIKVYPKTGQIHIVPYAGSPTVMMVAGGSGSSFPLLTGRLARNLPQVIWIDYTAGLSSIPTDIRAVIGKLAAIDVLGIAGDALLAGVASISTSVDGLSESMSTTASATNATYGARILQLRGEVNGFFGEGNPSKGEHGAGAGGARTYYKGFTMRIL